MTLGIIILIIIIILAIWGIGAYNGFIKKKNRIEEAFATMDVYLKKRWDLIPNLVNTVKAYAKHETDTFEKITAMRTKSYESLSPNEKIDANQALGGALGTIENFRDLMKQLEGLEDDIANSRKYYNGCVREMNTAVESFPTNIIANSFHFEKYRMYEVDDSKEREAIAVYFDPAEAPKVEFEAPAETDLEPPASEDIE